MECRKHHQIIVKTAVPRLEKLRVQNGKFSAVISVVTLGGISTAAVSLISWSANSAENPLSALVTRKKLFVDVNVITSVANRREYRNG